MTCIVILHVICLTKFWIEYWIESFFSIIQRSIEFSMSIAQCYSPPVHVQHFFIISLQSSAAGISTPTSFLDIATLLQRTHMPNVILPIVTFLESFQTLITKMYIYFIQNIKLYKVNWNQRKLFPVVGSFVVGYVMFKKHHTGREKVG